MTEGHPKIPVPGVGLCAICQHGQRVQSSRGSAFWLCARAASDPTFPKYPPLPVLQCRGYEPRTLDR